MIEIKELETKEEMLSCLSLLQEAYPNLTLEDLDKYLDDMLPYRYGMVAAMEDGVALGLSGYWIHTKIWMGRILEMDNVIVRADKRSQGLGDKLYSYLKTKALDNECKIMCLDAFVQNHAAHKFYVARGFVTKGFHFVKPLIQQ